MAQLLRPVAIGASLGAGLAIGSSYRSPSGSRQPAAALSRRTDGVTAADLPFQRSECRLLRWNADRDASATLRAASERRFSLGPRLVLAQSGRPPPQEG